MNHQAVIGLEVHAELLTQSKMFCSCRVVDSTTANPNLYTCPVCSGMPGTLPVTNQRAVYLGAMVALALHCEVAAESIFARKNYFYPDLPKGYQISQYERPLATNGHITISTSAGKRKIRIRRVHLEEDTGKLIHRDKVSGAGSMSLVDLNRAGVPLLEIVSEPDIRSASEAVAYAKELQSILTYLKVNSGNMEKGVIRFEANVSVRKTRSEKLNTRTEIKNLNSFRSLRHSTQYEIDRQISILTAGKTVEQQTLGWDEAREVTVAQRSKEQAHDYRYFPEPDLPPVQIDPVWLQKIGDELPELPTEKLERFRSMGLNEYDAQVLVRQRSVAEFFEGAVDRGSKTDPPIQAKTISNWLTSQLFGMLHNARIEIEDMHITPAHLVDLLALLQSNSISANSAKQVMREMLETRATPQEIISEHELEQVNDVASITKAVEDVLRDHPEEVKSLLSGKDSLTNWLLGQVMRTLNGKANPQIVRSLLKKTLKREADTNNTR
ncbi:MAG: Asp-tRNA(Asn)/Glu-tRNA(Gln) amidotransferase subunit GatB [Anaerolineales bacterium]|nr:Asp-tRNA(Asn)/Glu-tRNA(Gln) amidotransferase subunit GatB [Anaerolineales bacterium]